jgi:hypothetical protein
MISDKEKLNLIQKNYKDLVLKYNILDKNYKELCKEALEQPLTRDWKHTIDERIARDSEFKEALEQPAWQGLTDDELSHLKYLHVDYELFDEGEYGTECNVYVDDFAKAIEQALKEKNT